MKAILNKIFNKRKIFNHKDIEFEKLRNQTEIKKIFNAISKFSDNSELRYVGGCVRKILNKEEFDDIDLAANIEPNETILALKNNDINFHETGLKHGTVTASVNNKNFEITSLRRDVDTDGRHAKVEFSNNWREDALRRDFTFNSIYADLEGNLFDPFNGAEDLKNGKIKFIGNPESRIKEDYLRILRYIRFFLNYSKNGHDKKIKKAIKQNIVGVKNLSNERLLDELKKLVLSNGFLNLVKDEFCLEIILLIFPQLKNINLFNRLNKYAHENIHAQDFIFLLSLLVIDETSNMEYFLYKFNISNESKKRMKFLNEIFSKPLEKKTFSEKNLWKIFYFNGKDYLMDMINFQIYRSKKVDKNLLKLKNLFTSKNKPEFPVKAKNLIENYSLKEGIELGQKLKEIENIWIKNDFSISKKEIEKIAKN
tara:strand:- start:435 stop:1709 length:1275 start_codon:yes stop_codon:yes gene_type:complete